MKFLFSRREATAGDRPEDKNRQEFDDLAEAVRVAYAGAAQQPQATLDATKSLLKRVRTTRNLDKQQREILAAYVHDAAGHAYLELGQSEAGLAALGRALKTYQNLPDKTPQINNLLNQSRAWMLRNRLEPAARLLEQALVVAKESRLPHLEADVLFKLGVLYNLTDRPDRAQEIFGRGLLLTQQINQPVMTATFLAQFGQLYLQKGDLDKARDYYERSRTVFEEAADLDNLMISYGQLDQLARQQGDYGLALDYARKGLELARGQANTREELIFLQDLSRICQAQENFDEAAELARQSLTLAQKIKDRQTEVRSYQLLSTICLSRQDWAEAGQWIALGQKAAQEIGDGAALALFLNDLTDLKLAEGDPTAALAYLREMAALFKNKKDISTLVTVYLRMGDLYLENLHNPAGAAEMAGLTFELTTEQDGQQAMFAFTSTMRLIQLMAQGNYYGEGLQVSGQCLERANLELKGRAKRKGNPDGQGRWLLFVQVLVVLAGTLQDLKSGQTEHQGKVKEILGQMLTRFGDTFALDAWTTEMYERLK